MWTRGIMSLSTFLWTCAGVAQCAYAAEEAESSSTAVVLESILWITLFVVMGIAAKALSQKKK